MATKKLLKSQRLSKWERDMIQGMEAAGIVFVLREDGDAFFPPKYAGVARLYDEAMQEYLERHKDELAETDSGRILKRCKARTVSTHLKP